MKRLSLVVLCGLLACNVNAAEAMKVGIVNLDEVIVKAPLAISYGEKLSSDFKPRQDALDTAQRKLQDDVNQLTFNGYKMTADDRNKLTQTINSEKTEVDSLGSQLQKDFVAARNQYSQQMLTKLNSVIAKLAQDGHYDIIQTNTNMLYVNTAVNITQQVIDQMK